MDWPIIGTIKEGLKAVRGIVDDVNTTDEERAKAKARLKEIENATLEQAQRHAETMAQMRAENIQTEAASEDPWTSRARPTFMYVMYLVIITNTLLAPTVGVFFPEHMGIYFTHIGDGFGAIPAEVWATFTAGYLGYSYVRTREKEKGVAGRMAHKVKQQFG